MVIRKFLALVEVLLVLAGLAVAAGGWWQRQALQQPLAVEQELLIEVPAGSTPGGILNRLEEEGVLHDAFLLRLYWRFNLAGQALHSGEYRLTPGMQASGLLDLWRRGDVVQYAVTLVDGWTFRQVRAALAKQAKLEQTLSGLTDDEAMARLGQPGVHPEGRFYPDTYNFVRGTRDVDLLKQARQRLDKVLDEEWQARADSLPYRDAYDALIMASLVEKETGMPAERQQIAGVFVRRLQRGMLLQTDPTVIYGLGERYNGKLTRAHLREPTSYNTYVIAGLPPTPIAMVSRDAIHAALHPDAGSSLYFVARGDGSHAFSDSLDAHNQAVRDYQLKRRADYRSSPEPLPRPKDGAPTEPSSPIPESDPRSAQ